MKRTVVVAPHPDDEVLGCSSVLLGSEVAVIHVTDGVPPWIPAPEQEDLRATRQAESARAWESLSSEVEPVRLGFGDLTAWRLVEEVARGLLGVVGALQEGDVYLPAYQRGHPDHDATYLAGALARQRLAPGHLAWHVYGLYGFDRARRVRFGWLPPEAYGTADERSAEELLRAKGHALRQHGSQVWPDSALDLWLQDPQSEQVAPLPEDWAGVPKRLTAAGFGWYYDEELGFGDHGASAAAVEASFRPVLA
jgi:LmbE family N-acetylglucosaminyl deacetylase